jgi:hypothetical protein
VEKSMITIFSIPKAFKGHIDVIQRNALHSWTMLNPKCEIILCGDDPGVNEVALEFGVKHIPDIAYNEFGTPLVNSAFEKVVEVAQFPHLCYVNTDIILLNDLLAAIKRIPFNQFVAIGRRTNVEIMEQWDFKDLNWRSQLTEFATKNGKLGGVDWIDCFVFTPNRYIEIMPPFLVGRPKWDNWFITNARKNHLEIIDFTRVCPIIHQNHDYSHIPAGNNKYWSGPEADYNRQLFENIVGKTKRHGNIWDATHILTRNFLLPALGLRYLRQRWYTAVVLHPSLRPLAEIVDPIMLLPNFIKNHLKRIFG